MLKNIRGIIQELEQVKFVLRDSIGLDSSETFGIEIEFENVDLDDIKKIDKWTLKKDDTVTKGNVGGELISPILVDNEETWKQIDNNCRYLKNKNALTTSKTGSHIHIGSQILKENPNNIRKFLKTWELFENVIFYFAYGKDTMPRLSLMEQARPISRDLYRIRNSKNGYSQFGSYYDWYHFFQKKKFDKHAGINFMNYKGYEMDEKNTIEIRCPNGTLDAAIWQNNINFFTTLLCKVTEPNFDEQLIDYYLDKKSAEEYDLLVYSVVDVEKAIALSDLIFDDRLDRIMFLKQYLKCFEKDNQYVKK